MDNHDEAGQSTLSYEERRIYTTAFNQYRAEEVGRWRDASIEANRWQLEAVKHLALLNGTALTGTVALLAIKVSSPALLIPLVAFLAAFVVLVYGMHLACRGYNMRASDYVGRISRLDSKYAQTDPKSATQFAAGNVTVAAYTGDETLNRAVRCAWGSVGVFFLGVTSLLSILICDM